MDLVEDNTHKFKKIAKEKNKGTTLINVLNSLRSLILHRVNGTIIKVKVCYSVSINKKHLCVNLDIMKIHLKGG